MRREVREKGADWGELRRIKRHVVVKKGLPSVPSLVINTDEGLSYMVIIHWKKEVRLYLFGTEGNMLHGVSYFSSLEEVSKDLHSKSKKIVRYPPLEKKLTRAQQNYQLDLKFKQIWVQLVKKLKIPKSQRRQRPLIKCILQQAEGIFGTNFTKDFIYVPYQSPNLGVIFHYYSLFFFLPPSIRQNEDLAEALVVKLLPVFKFEVKSFLKGRDSLKIIRRLDSWDSIEPLNFFNLLKKVTIYYDFPWNTEEFIMLMDLPSELLKNPSRQKLPNLFCQLFSNSQNLDFLILACLLGIPFNFNCQISPKFSKHLSISFYNWIKNCQFSKALPFMKQKRIHFSSGQMRAIQEALQFQYANILQFNLDNDEIFEIENKSDIPVVLSSALKILSNGTENEINFDPIVLNANSTISLDVKSMNITNKSPLRFQYLLVNSLKDTSRPIFIGTIVI
ncbi:MAG: hypothetical protein JSW11_21965 [Candidatus Heimdallarchaeota archaeon]|nr:MAG: hypothetical protein JSW11_21965 [Candidatus Heimdallarchaeota archaeon]